MAEFVDVATPVGGRSGGGDSHHRGPRTHVTETVELGSIEATPVAKSGVEREVITVSPRATVAGRPLSDRAKEMLANIEAHDTVDAPESSSPAAADPVVAPAIPSAATVPPAAAPATSTPAPEPAKPAADEVAAARDRALEHNTRLLAELDTLKKRPARGEPSPREKALDEIERMYIEDPVGANRRLAALALGIEDPAHKDVDKLQTWLYNEYTEKALGVPLDNSTKSLHESERNRLLMARDKRDRAAEAAKPAAEQPQPVDAVTAQKTGRVAQLIGSGDHGTKYPMLRGLSQDFDGMKPEELLWREIDRGFQTGEYDRSADDTILIDRASQKIETHYKALGEKILKLLPSTATATQAPAATDDKASPTGNGTRTITAASASVAPATLPATKSAPTTEAPKYKNEAERRKAIAARLFPDAT